MSSYLELPIVEARLAAYMESEDLERDISWLENRALCEADGHQLEVL